MFKKYCLFQPLKNCVIGNTYQPEFYSFIKDADVRRRYEQIAYETEEDFKNLERLLQSFGVETIRPIVDSEADFKTRIQSRAWYDQFELPSQHDDYPTVSCIVPPPLQPRDWIMMMDDKFITWFIEPEQYDQYQNIVSYVEAQGNKVYHTNTNLNSEGWMTKIGKRMTYGGAGPNFSKNDVRQEYEKFIKEFGQNNGENLIYDENGWRDSWYRPLKPGLLISVMGSEKYKKDFANWDVITTEGDDNLNSMYKFLRFKQKHNHNLWNYGEEGDAARAALSIEWLDNGWREYCSENVFDCNMLSVDENNVIIFNYNKRICNELEKHGINVHVSHYRHRYFWSGGIHCITCDLNRDGELIDYFN